MAKLFIMNNNVVLGEHSLILEQNFYFKWTAGEARRVLAWRQGGPPQTAGADGKVSAGDKLTPRGLSLTFHWDL